MQVVGGNEQRSRWDTVRRRWAPLAFLGVLVLIATRTCGTEPVDVTIELVFGAGRERARAVHVEYFRGGEPDPVGHMKYTYGPGGATVTARQQLSLTPGSYRAVIHVTTDAAPLELERVLRVENEATIRVSVDLPIPRESPP
jgi:hypothetical protein